jgi:hypothetical protein
VAARISTLVIGLLLLTSACGGSGGTSGTTSAQPGSEQPAAQSGPLDPNFDFGQRVTITAAGFRPLWLVSIIHQPIVWTNTTDTPQSVVFDHLSVRSGPIPPGGSYTWTPDSVASITYHSGVHPALKGKLQASWSSTDEANANSGG